MSMQQGPHETPDEYLSRLEARIDELQKEAIDRKTAIFRAQNDERIIAELETSRDFHRNASSTRFALLQASKKRVAELEARIITARAIAQKSIDLHCDVGRTFEYLRITKALDGKEMP